MWDVLPAGKHLGGAPANFAYHAGQQGAESTVVSRIGNDDLGSEIRSVLDSKGLSSSLQTDMENPTGTVTVEIAGEGIPEYVIHQPVAWDFLDYNSELKELASECDAVCFGSLAQRNEVSGQSIRSFVENTGPKALRIFDINLRQEFYSKELIDQNLHLANVVKFNDDEYEILRGMYDLPNDELLFIREMINRFDLSHLVFTKGGDGSYFSDRDFTSYLRTPEIEIVDTIGAGDSFTATIVMGILNENPVTETHKKAIEVSAFVCSSKGAMPEYN